MITGRAGNFRDRRVGVPLSHPSYTRIDVGITRCGSARYLLQLPVTQRATLSGKKFLLVHATPRDPLDEYVLKDPVTWERRLQNVDADIVCVGHSHMQFKLEVSGKIVLNPGSVGLPRDGDVRAAYAIIEDDRIDLKRLEYPVERHIARLNETPWPPRAKEMLSEVFREGRLPRDDRKLVTALRAASGSTADAEPDSLPDAE